MHESAGGTEPQPGLCMEPSVDLDVGNGEVDLEGVSDGPRSVDNDFEVDDDEGGQQGDQPEGGQPLVENPPTDLDPTKESDWGKAYELCPCWAQAWQATFQEDGVWPKGFQRVAGKLLKKREDVHPIIFSSRSGQETSRIFGPCRFSKIVEAHANQG